MKQYVNVLGDIFPMPTAAVLKDIGAERKAQDEKFPDQNIPDGTNHRLTGAADMARVICDECSAVGTLTWRDVLAEEVAEAFATEDLLELRKELIQVAAVAARWAESIDNRRVGLE